MRGLIANADDFGLSPGVNRGISKAHRDGVVRSASLMVDTPFSAEAAAMAMEMPGLSVGLHADLSTALAEAPRGDAGEVGEQELERQIERFRLLAGRWPSHLDSHHNLHRREDLVESFVQVGRRYRLRVREHCDARYVSNFYGQWGGSTHLEQISIHGLERVLRACTDGLIELACHPGYCDDVLRSSYRSEREAELRTLCDEGVPHLLADLRFVLLDSRLRVDPTSVAGAHAEQSSA
jgi:chitin disaccharide deacetylase